MTEPRIACTLGAADLQARLQELKALSGEALLSARREGLTLYLRYAPEAEGRVRQMVEKEEECCAFLSFAVQPTPGAIEVRIVAPEAARESVEWIYAQFLATLPAQEGGTAGSDRVRG